MCGVSVYVPDRLRWDADRTKAALAAVAVQAAIGYALVVGLAVHFSRVADDALKLFVATPPPPPPPPVRLQPKRVVSKRPEGAASPPNLRSKATEIVAPRPIVVVVPPPRIVAAVKPSVGSDAMSGAAEVRGPGTGSGGVGNGTGSGGYGDGDGDGGDETPPRFVKGRLSISDLPQSVRDGSFDGTVGVRYVVAPDGRVPDCEVTRSSGNAEIDALTCRLIRERFRFKPSRDARGRPVYSQLVESHTWVVEPEPPRE